jgi:hypothetical protein
MSRTLYATVKTHLPGSKTFNQFVLPSRAVYSTSRTEQTLNQQLTVYLQHQHISNPPRSLIPRRQQQRQDLNQSLISKPNMSFLLPGLRRGFIVSTPLLLSTPLLIHQFRSLQPIRCDGPDPFSKIAGDLTRGGKTPIITESGAANPRAIRQVSMGSILGVFCGLGISVFSKPLAILIGLGIFVLQVS